MKYALSLLATLTVINANAQSVNPDQFLKTIASQHKFSECPDMKVLTGKWHDPEGALERTFNIKKIPNGYEIHDAKDDSPDLVDGSIRTNLYFGDTNKAVESAKYEYGSHRNSPEIVGKLQISKVVACINQEIVYAYDETDIYLLPDGSTKQVREQDLTRIMLEGKNHILFSTELASLSDNLNASEKKQITEQLGGNGSVTLVRIKKIKYKN